MFTKFVAEFSTKTSQASVSSLKIGWVPVIFYLLTDVNKLRSNFPHIFKNTGEVRSMNSPRYATEQIWVTWKWVQGKSYFTLGRKLNFSLFHTLFTDLETWTRITFFFFNQRNAAQNFTYGLQINIHHYFPYLLSISIKFHTWDPKIMPLNICGFGTKSVTR